MIRNRTRPLASFKLLRGVGSLGALRILSLGVEFSSIFLLMGMLGPSPFGIVAMAEGALVIVTAIGDGGIGRSLVSKQSPKGERYSAAIVVALTLGIAVTVACLAATPLVEAYYRNPDVVVPWVVLSSLWCVGLVQTVPQAVLQIEERFALLGYVQLGTTVLASAGALSLAQVSPDAWPLILRRALLMLGSLGACFYLARLRPLPPTRDDFRSVVNFSRGVIGFNLLNAIARNLDKVLIGRYLGDTALGLYSVAYRVLLTALSQLTGLLGTVAYPRLAALMPNKSMVADALAALIASTLRVATPGLLAIALVAPQLVRTLFGTAWAGAAAPMQILALLAVYQVPFAQSGLAFTATRQTALMFKWALVSTPVIAFSFGLGLRHGIEGVALYYAVTSILLAPALVIAMSRACGVSPRVFWLAAGSAALSAALFSLPVLAARVLAVGLKLDDGPTILLAAAGACIGTGWSLAAETRHTRLWNDTRPGADA